MLCGSFQWKSLLLRSISGFVIPPPPPPLMCIQRHANMIALLLIWILFYKCHGKFTQISQDWIKQTKNQPSTEEFCCSLIHSYWFVRKILPCRCQHAFRIQSNDISSRRGKQFCCIGNASIFCTFSGAHHSQLQEESPCDFFFWNLIA